MIYGKNKCQSLQILNMNHKMKFIIFQISFFILFLQSLYSQNIKLETCIENAFLNRIELKKQGNQQSYYRNNYQYSKYELLPSINSRMDFNFTGENLTIKIKEVIVLKIMKMGNGIFLLI